MYSFLLVSSLDFIQSKLEGNLGILHTGMADPERPLRRLFQKSMKGNNSLHDDGVGQVYWDIFEQYNR